MTHDQDPRQDQQQDSRIADLLQADLRRDAPAERDPLFRVAVLGRLERTKYRRRLHALLACAAVLAVIAAIGLSVGGAVREGTSALLIAAALAAAYFVVAPILTRLLARLRS